MNPFPATCIRLGAAALLLALPAFIVTACGDDDNGGSKATATSQKTSPTVAQDPAAAYKSKALAAATQLTKETDKLMQDMLAAQTSQSDPKWPGILQGDADLVIAAAKAVKSVQPPAGQFADSVTKLNAAADKLTEGANFMKDATKNNDQLAGMKAFTSLGEGKGLLEQASVTLK